MSAYTQQKYEVLDVGIMHPGEVSTGALFAGQVGFVACGIRNSKDAQIGDTFFHPHAPVEPLKGFKPMSPMVRTIFKSIGNCQSHFVKCVCAQKQ
ncbi:translation factor GUF1 homolog, mitochondrial-like [Orbicella faveolata]|uniref:translation factor GUF1 homolog, mitochondrial-like n=1 Tax=Orbicella faveolata TaxID=48498 RepID=UPI0009E3B5B5|nr:translation factor GUF1 homolog, mitochondrial-like [Orbicella faveolata]